LVLVEELAKSEIEKMKSITKHVSFNMHTIPLSTPSSSSSQP